MSVTNGSSGNGATHVGRSMRRKEDPRLITGQGVYVDDIVLPGQLWAAWVRSPEANAKIVSIDTSAAKARNGVHAVFTNEDLDMEAGLPMAWVPPGVEVKTPEHWVLAKGEVKHVGDPVALVIGEDRYGVVDAAEDVLVEYEPLPVVVDPEKALEAGSPLVHESLGTNKICEWSLGGGDLEAGFAEADVIVERRVVNHRMAGAAIEPRGVLAEYRGDKLTVWSSTQIPHFLRLFLSMLLGIGEEKVRVIAPEVGGGFGSKLNIYAEEIGCAWASRKLGRPVKWIETRSEGMMVTHHGRDQIDYVRAGAKRDGTLTAFHAKIIADCGAYQMLLTPMIPPLSGFVMCGVYNTPAVQTDIIDVMTNKFPTDAIRGAGRPESTHMIEVVMDQLADELGMDRLEIRRKNFIPPFSAGHETPIGVVYDSGDYDADARQAARAHRPGTGPKRSRAASWQRDLPRHRLQHLHRDLRQRAVADRRTRRLRRCRAGAGSRRPSASTRPATSRCTPAPLPTGRATRPASPRSSPTSSGSTHRRSR